MKKLLVLLISVITLFLAVSCVPPPAGSGNDVDVFLEEAEEGGAVAGQAIQIGACPQSRTVLSCTAREDGSYDVTYRSGRTASVSRNLANTCSIVRGQEQAYQVLGCRTITSSKGSVSQVVGYCTFQCEAGETCENGFCVSPEEPGCYYLDNEGSQLPAGTTFGQLRESYNQPVNFSGVVAGGEMFGPFCATTGNGNTGDIHTNYLCGSSPSYTSGPGVSLYPVVGLGPTVEECGLFTCNPGTAACCDEDTAKFNCGSDDNLYVQCGTINRMIMECGDGCDTATLRCRIVAANNSTNTTGVNLTNITT